jgi:hypothetical protein
MDLEMKRPRVRVAASLAALLIAACTSNTLPEWSRNPRYSGCASTEVRAISRAFARAAQLSDRARAAIAKPANRRRAESGEWNAYSWWFGEFAPRRFDSVVSVFGSTRAEFGKTIGMRCAAKAVNCPAFATHVPPGSNSPDGDESGAATDSDPVAGREWLEFAYSNHRVGVVELCPDFFDETPNHQAAILFHELTHVSSDTSDSAYREHALLALARAHPEQAARNAASYAAFAESIAFGRTPLWNGVPMGDD